MVPMTGTNGLGLAALVDLIDGPGATWSEHAAEQDAIARMKVMRADGASVRAIQTAMKAQGVSIALATISKLTN